MELRDHLEESIVNIVLSIEENLLQARAIETIVAEMRDITIGDVRTDIEMTDTERTDIKLEKDKDERYRGAAQRDTISGRNVTPKSIFIHEGFH